MASQGIGIARALEADSIREKAKQNMHEAQDIKALDAKAAMIRERNTSIQLHLMEQYGPEKDGAGEHRRKQVKEARRAPATIPTRRGKPCHCHQRQQGLNPSVSQDIYNYI